VLQSTSSPLPMCYPGKGGSSAQARVWAANAGTEWVQLSPGAFAVKRAVLDQFWHIEKASTRKLSHNN